MYRMEKKFLKNVRNLNSTFLHLGVRSCMGEDSMPIALLEWTITGNLDNVISWFWIPTTLVRMISARSLKRRVWLGGNQNKCSRREYFIISACRSSTDIHHGLNVFILHSSDLAFWNSLQTFWDLPVIPHSTFSCFISFFIHLLFWVPLQIFSSRFPPNSELQNFPADCLLDHRSIFSRSPSRLRTYDLLNTFREVF